MKKSVSSQVCDTILDDIFHNTYKPGQILTERSLIETYGVSKTTIATAWILRHPARMQVVAGTASESRLTEIIAAEKVELTREEWYRLYLAAGHILP